MSALGKLRSKMRIGFRVGGLHFLSVQWGEVRGYSLHVASWHNPKHMCWLWSLMVDRCVADEKRAVRVFSIPGHQARYVAQLWAVKIEFVWQAEGWYRSPAHDRQSKLAGRIGVRL